MSTLQLKNWITDEDIKRIEMMLHQKKRLCIFSFYDESGIVDRYVEFLLADLKKCVERLIIVVNGTISDAEKNKLYSQSEDVIVRKNEGFDAGAYKYALIHYIGFNSLYSYDELILCNDTFFGPFISFKDIFSDMDRKDCSFWGLNYIDMTIAAHLQSYFLVFRNDIIHGNEFIEYIMDSIDENTNNIIDVYAQFETGLFFYLVHILGKKYESYSIRNSCDVYLSSNYCLKKYNLPLIKKKALNNIDIAWDNLLDSMKYVVKQTAYPLSYILGYISKVYGIHLESSELTEYRIEVDKLIEVEVDNPVRTEEELSDYINNSNGFYIYGTGIWARKIYWMYCRDQAAFKGFLVSDLQSLNYTTLYDKTITQFTRYHYHGESEAQIILGMDRKNTREVMNKMDIEIGDERIFCLW